MSDLRAALVAIQELHRSVPIYTTWVEDCGHDFECDPVEIDGDSYCPDETDGVTCGECVDIARNFGLDDGLPVWPCPTRRLADEGLGGETNG